jgi:branched-chain amino acid transport system substrate-binding protein
MFMTKHGGIVVGVVLTVLSASSGHAQPAAKVVRIGVINSLTGPYTAYSEPVRDGLDLALEQINEKGGIRGRKVQLIVEDDGGDAQAAVKAFEKLANKDKVSVILGPMTAAGALATAELATKHRVVQIHPVAHAPELARASPYVFLIPTTTDVAARAKARLVIERFKPKRVALLNDANPIAAPAVAVWKEQLKTAGAEVVAEQSFKMGDNDFKERLQKIREANPDIVVYPSYYDYETVAIVTQAREIGIRAPLVGSGMSCLTALERIGPLVLPELYFVDEAFGPAFRDQVAMQTFSADYSRKFNKTAGFESAAGHAALNVVKSAMERGGFERAGVQRSLRTASLGTALGPVKYQRAGANLAGQFALFSMSNQGELALVR